MASGPPIISSFDTFIFDYFYQSFSFMSDSEVLFKPTFIQPILHRGKGATQYLQGMFEITVRK